MATLALADCLVSDLDASKLAGVILVGGWMPDKLRRDAKVKQIISELAFEWQTGRCGLSWWMDGRVGQRLQRGEDHRLSWYQR